MTAFPKTRLYLDASGEPAYVDLNAAVTELDLAEQVIEAARALEHAWRHAERENMGLDETLDYRRQCGINLRRALAAMEQK